tara:strand:- start:350 stop:826 length:477 start_codon:yes stop_codon:yes gene_type:complete
MWDKNFIKLYIDFFNTIKHTIPCYICSQNFKRKINQKGLSISENCQSKEKMIKWLVSLHNLVNKSNNKKEYNIEDVYNIYIKNNKLILNKGHFIKFIKEYIYFNIRINKKKNAIKLLYILAVIFPEPTKRKMLIKYIKNKKRKNIKQFIINYIHIINK